MMQPKRVAPSHLATAPEPGGPVGCPEDADLDESRFRHLLALAGPAVQGELLARLIEDFGAARATLADGLARSDRAAIRSGSHVLIALAGTVGADRLHDAARALHDASGSEPAAEGARVLALADRLVACLSAPGGWTVAP